MVSYDNGQFAEMLRMQRAKANISQASLAMRTGINAVTISQYEQGARVPGVDKVFALAQALDCTPNDLLGWRDAR